MSKEVLITDILTNKLKSVQGEIEGQTKTNKSAKSQPDDEWSVDGDPIKGRKNKESILEGCNYTIGYITAVKDLIPEFLEFLNKTESELKKYD